MDINLGQILTEIGQKLGAKEPGRHSEASIEAVIREFLESIESHLVAGNDVLIFGFGKFFVKTLPPREGYNPAKQEKTSLPERKIPRFKFSVPLANKIKGVLNPAPLPAGKSRKRKAVTPVTPMTAAPAPAPAPVPTETPVWYIAYKGEQHGPLTTSEVIEQFSGKRKVMVCQTGWTEWKPMNKVDEFKPKQLEIPVPQPAQLPQLPQLPPISA